MHEQCLPYSPSASRLFPSTLAPYLQNLLPSTCTIPAALAYHMETLAHGGECSVHAAAGGTAHALCDGALDKSDGSHPRERSAAGVTSL